MIDTPGLRAFGLWGFGPHDLEQAYVEFRRYLGECRFSDCRHDREPGCAVRAAVGDTPAAAVSERRYTSYRRLLNLSLDMEARRSKGR